MKTILKNLTKKLFLLLFWVQSCFTASIYVSIMNSFFVFFIVRNAFHFFSMLFGGDTFHIFQSFSPCSSGDSTARMWTIADGACRSSSKNGPLNVLVLKHVKGRMNEKSQDVTTLDWNVSFSYGFSCNIWLLCGRGHEAKCLCLLVTFFFDLILIVRIACFLLKLLVLYLVRMQELELVGWDCEKDVMLDEY